jgi:ATP:corrinoid adenosyltransferase
MVEEILATMDSTIEIQHLAQKRKWSPVLIITGNGKGKTTTALGIAVRACGHGLRTCIIQFMKGNPYPFREHRPPEMHLVLTGRDADPETIPLDETLKRCHG